MRSPFIFVAFRFLLQFVGRLIVNEPSVQP